MLYAYDIDGTRISQTSTTRRLSDNVILSGQSVRYNVDMLNPTGYSQVLEEFVSNYTPDDAGNPAQGGTWSTPDLYRSYLIGLRALGQSFAPGYESAGIDTSGIGGPVIRFGGLSYNLLDGHGSVQMLLSAQGVPLKLPVFKYDDATGKLLKEPNYFRYLDTTITPLGYAGEYRDARTGLIYLRDRWMNPATGRFTQADRFRRGVGADLLGVNLYTYANGDGVNRRDPSGQYSLVELLSVAFVQGTKAVTYVLPALRVGFAIYDAFTVAYITGKMILHGPSSITGTEWANLAFATAGLLVTGPAGKVAARLILKPFILKYISVPKDALKSFQAMKWHAGAEVKWIEAEAQTGTNAFNEFVRGRFTVSFDGVPSITIWQSGKTVETVLHEYLHFIHWKNMGKQSHEAWELYNTANKAKIEEVVKFVVEFLTK